MIEAFKHLGITVPIFAFSHCRDVVAAVSKAGGLGVLGLGLHSDEQIDIDLRWIEDQIDGAPYGVNLLMPGKYVGMENGGLEPEEAADAIPAEVTAFLDDMMRRYGVPESAAAAEDHFATKGRGRYTAKDSAAMLDIAFRFNPRLLVSALGTPSPEIMKAARDRGMLVAALAGRVKHAERHAKAGVDIIIAQSYEAGGHTGDIGAMVLIPTIVDAVAPTPVLAAGGIADGRQLAAAFALGAQGVWCGSVWLTTAESDTLPVVKKKLIAATAEDTVKSLANSGKPSRLLRTAWAEEWARSDTPNPLPNPLQPMAVGRYMARIDRAAASEHTNPQEGPGALASTPVGQVVGLMNSETSCRQVVREMMERCVDALTRVQAGLEEE
jgi:NAD(P)H-dependent flavin oxidoreductase YrpB (nitropropane dioxygenase family)